MKKNIILICLCLIGVGAYAQQEEVVDKVAAVVGRNIVKLSDVEKSFAQVRLKQGISNADSYRCEMLESMMISKLLIYKGEVDSIEVTDDEVENYVQYELKNMLRQFGTKEAFRQATGYTYDEAHDFYFDMYHDYLLSHRVQANLTETVKVTPAEVASYFNSIPADSLQMIEEEYEVAQILMQPKISETERDRVRTELAKLRERVLNGEKFSMLATLYSQDPGSSKKGGELGFFTRGDMVGEFESAAFALKPGEVSPIIETQYGFHILQLIERRGNNINCRHILICPKVSAEDLLKSRIKLDSIAQAIRQGNITFEEAAKQYSDGTTKTIGGVMTDAYTGSNRFTKASFAERYPGISISNMEANEVSNATPLTTDDNKDAYHIITLIKKHPSHKLNLADDYDKIQNAALEKAKNDKVMEWAQRQIRNTYIRIADDYKDCNFKLKWF